MFCAYVSTYSVLYTETECILYVDQENRAKVLIALKMVANQSVHAYLFIASLCNGILLRAV